MMVAVVEVCGPGHALGYAQTPDIQRPTPNAQRPIPNTQHPTRQTPIQPASH